MSAQEVIASILRGPRCEVAEAPADVAGDPGFRELRAVFQTLLSEALLPVRAELAEARKEIAALKVSPVDGNDILKARELADELRMSAPTDGALLQKLHRWCSANGLRPMGEARGWGMAFRRADVDHAKSYAAGEVSRKKQMARVA